MLVYRGFIREDSNALIYILIDDLDKFVSLGTHRSGWILRAVFILALHVHHIKMRFVRTQALTT